MYESKSKVRVLLCGGTLTGNLGGPAMYDSIVDELKKYNLEIEVTILSKYPNDDKAECEIRGYNMVAYPTMSQLVIGGSFFVLGSILKLLHIPYHWMAKKGGLDAYFVNDIMIDTSGISFSDDRSFSNVLINTLWFLPAIVSGIPMVKMSQSMGPYNKWYVKLLGKIVLNRLEFMVCRGEKSYKLTKAFLKKDNIYNLPDTAFCLEPLIGNEKDELLRRYQLISGEYIAVGPSYVMRDYFDKGVYSDIVAEALNNIVRISKRKIIFVPHSWIHSAQVGADTINDDLAVCKEIASKMDTESYEIVSEGMSARHMKALIGSAYMTIGSRYHFLIAALSSGVPSMALGWSHKYRELFREFDIDEYVLEYTEMNCEKVKEYVAKIYENRDVVKEKIEEKLSDVIKRSANNEKYVFDFLKQKGLV